METLIVETQKITKGALKAIKEGLEDEKRGAFIPHDRVMKSAKELIAQWEKQKSGVNIN